MPIRKSLKYVVPGVLALALIGLVAYKIKATDPSKDSRGPRVTLVKTEKPVRQRVVRKLTYTGDVVAGLQASIYSKISGNVESIYANIGTPVKKGQLLAVIDSTELYQQCQLNVATYQNARVFYDRSKQLFERSLASKQDLDNAEAAMKVARANYDLAKTRLSYARITAPFAGYITKRFLDPGAVVTANISTLFMLMVLDSVKVIVNIREKDVVLVEKGTKAAITVDSYPNKEFYGRVSRFAEAIDLSTRTMTVEIDIPNREHLLKPGMYGTVSLIVGERPDALTVLTYAIMRDDSSAYLFVVENSVARRKRIVKGNEEDVRTEVVDGVSANDQVIVVGQQLARDGGPVLIQTN